MCEPDRNPILSLLVVDAVEGKTSMDTTASADKSPAKHCLLGSKRYHIYHIVSLAATRFG